MPTTYDKDYYEANKESIKAANRRYYHRNKELVAKRHKKYDDANPEKKKERAWSYNRSLNGRFYSIKKNAKERDLVFEITLDDFEANFFNKACFYCGDPSTGMDRVDNDKGYTSENCVPCCKDCNVMKLAHTQEKFINHLEKIITTLLDKNLIQEDETFIKLVAAIANSNLLKD